MSSSAEVYLSHLVTEMTIIADNAQLTFGSLTAQQLNWRPSTEFGASGSASIT